MLNFTSKNTLCKFTTLNKNIINSLFENKLWHARVDTLNDPFEFYFNFIKELPSSTSALSKLMEGSNYWATAELKEQEKKGAIQLLSASEENELRSRILKVAKDFEIILETSMRTLNVCSLSNAYDEPLMWSHYGDGMRGICLIYDKEKLKNSSLEFESIQYEEKPPEVNFFDIYRNYKETNLGEFLLTKHTGWRYEKEYRSIMRPISTSSKELGILRTLEENTLKAIIIGAKASNVDIALIETLSHTLGFEIYTAKANSQQYKVDISKFHKQKTR